MLTLLIFAPCEKIILGQDDTASIINVLETVKVNVTGDLPPNALIPFRWSLMSLWKRDETPDTPIEFEQHVEVLRRDDSVAAQGTNTFTVSSNHLMYRLIAEFPVFPIGQPGTVLVKSRIRQVNPETEWRDVAEFPLLVVHEQKPNEEETRAGVEAQV